MEVEQAANNIASSGGKANPIFSRSTERALKTKTKQGFCLPFAVPTGRAICTSLNLQTPAANLFMNFTENVTLQLALQKTIAEIEM